MENNIPKLPSYEEWNEEMNILERKNDIEESWEQVKIEMLKTNELVYRIYLQNEELLKRLGDDIV